MEESREDQTVISGSMVEPVIYPMSDSGYELLVTPPTARPGSTIEVVAPADRLRNGSWNLCVEHPRGWRGRYLLFPSADGLANRDLDIEEAPFVAGWAESGPNLTSLTLPTSLEPGTYQLRLDGLRGGTALIATTDWVAADCCDGAPNNRLLVAQVEEQIAPERSVDYVPWNRFPGKPRAPGTISVADDTDMDVTN